MYCCQFNIRLPRSQDCSELHYRLSPTYACGGEEYWFTDWKRRQYASWTIRNADGVVIETDWFGTSGQVSAGCADNGEHKGSLAEFITNTALDSCIQDVNSSKPVWEMYLMVALKLSYLLEILQNRQLQEFWKITNSPTFLTLFNITH
jgi:hypothetical protein